MTDGPTDGRTDRRTTTLLELLRAAKKTLGTLILILRASLVIWEKNIYNFEYWKHLYGPIGNKDSLVGNKSGHIGDRDDNNIGEQDNSIRDKYGQV